MKIEQYLFGIASISVLTNFNEFNLSEELLSAIAAMGFEQPSEIQVKTIPTLLAGKDVIGQAATGTGKTASFGIPAIEAIDKNFKKPQVLILCPTRELCVQVSEEMKKLTRNQEISVLSVYGGQDISIQLKALKRGSRKNNGSYGS